MLFTSFTFLVFLIIMLVVYWITNHYNNKSGKLLLLVGSYVFYSWWDWRFLILIVISSLCDFLIGKYVHQSTKNSLRKQLLFLSIFINIGILGIFKYFNFFIESFQILTGIDSSKNWSTLNIILPVGISFYTFQTLSYTIDIYRKRIQPTESMLTFFTFVAFFPQLVAGPIERASRLIPQIEKAPVFSYRQAGSGLKLMLWGFFKKMVIADQLGVIVDTIYAEPASFQGWGVLIATLLFGYQIYCDFSGYSDIAIGTARLFGIELMTNFKTPYLATSLRNFWHRWHISLSTWFRDYIYIALGGNQSSAAVWIKNIILTFFISGLWHGANVTFLIWGSFHGLFYVLEKYLSPVFRLSNKLKNRMGWLITFLLVNVSWLFFRANSMSHIKTLISELRFLESSTSTNLLKTIFTEHSFTPAGRMLLFIFPLFIASEFVLKQQAFDEAVSKLSKPVQWVIFYLIVLIILFFGLLNSAPQFIYFQF